MKSPIQKTLEDLWEKFTAEPDLKKRRAIALQAEELLNRVLTSGPVRL